MIPAPPRAILGLCEELAIDTCSDMHDSVQLADGVSDAGTAHPDPLLTA